MKKLLLGSKPALGMQQR